MDRKRLISQYHPPHVGESRLFFEIAVGAILTQNVAWKNVEKALANLIGEGLLAPGPLYEAGATTIAHLIRPAGYFNQKSKHLMDFLSWYRSFGYRTARFKEYTTGELRKELLTVKGIGPETADSILLYGLSRKIFVIDAYTRRIAGRIGIAPAESGYDRMQSLFHRTFKGEVADYKEFHAVLVELAKAYCRKNPRCHECLVSSRCAFHQSPENNVHSPLPRR